MALSVSRGEPFHLETIYAIDYRTFPSVFDRRKIVELGRWVAKAPGVAEGLLYAAVWWGLQHGCMWGIGEVKPGVARRFAMMGIVVHALAGSPIFENIPVGACLYYLVSPPPALKAIALRDTEAVLRRKIATLVQRGIIALELS